MRRLAVAQHHRPLIRQHIHGLLPAVHRIVCPPSREEPVCLPDRQGKGHELLAAAGVDRQRLRDALENRSHYNEGDES